MAVTVTDLMRTRVRIDLAGTETSLPDTLIDDYYLRAEERFPTNTEAMEISVRLLAIRAMRAFFSKRADYTQNASDERLSQITRNLERLYEDYKKDLIDATPDNDTLVRFHSLQSPRRGPQSWPDTQTPPWGWIETYDISRGLV